LVLKKLDVKIPDPPIENDRVHGTPTNHFRQLAFHQIVRSHFLDHQLVPHFESRGLDAERQTL